jgi:hypothetical protein
MPGIDTRAPERTATKSGFLVEPKPLLVLRSNRESARSTSATSPVG